MWAQGWEQGMWAADPRSGCAHQVIMCARHGKEGKGKGGLALLSRSLCMSETEMLCAQVCLHACAGACARAYACVL